MRKAKPPDVEPTAEAVAKRRWHGHPGAARRDVPRRRTLAAGSRAARDATGHRAPRLAGVRLQPDPLGSAAAARSSPRSPAPLAQHIPPGLNPSRSSSSSPYHPSLSGWSCSPGPGQSPPSVIHARAAPPARLPRRSEAERAVLCRAGRAPPSPARCPLSTGECCGRGVREEGSWAAPAGPRGAAGGDEAPPPSPAAGGRSWPGERGPPSLAGERRREGELREAG